MHCQLKFLFFMVAMVGCSFEMASTAETEKLKVHVYYETLCPDSMRFMLSLNNSMLNHKWLNYTDLHFVPYGKRWTNPNTNVVHLFCQHRQPECELNALHACIVEHNTVEEQMRMFSCLMRRFNTDVDECAKQLSIDVSAAKECKATRSLVDILEKYGQATDLLDISFVPSITIDEEFNRWEQRRMINSFDTIFCKKYKQKFDIQLDYC